MPSISFDTYSASNSIGLMHGENQDSYFADKDNLLFAVADGVGGYRGAKEASTLATEELRKEASTISNEGFFESCLQGIHSKIQQRARFLGFRNMGTTIAAAKVFPSGRESGKVITANAGDSPILLFPKSTEGFRKIFVDDSHRGEDPSLMFGIIQYLGLPDCDLEVHISSFEYSRGDILLLCSDGITDNLLSPILERTGSQSSLSTLVREERSAEKLVKFAIEVAIKPDDMTAILVFL